MNLNFSLVEKYISKLSLDEPTYLEFIRKETKGKDFPHFMLSGAYQGRFLSFLSKICKPKYILEIGTFIGYSALCLAEGLIEGGKLITLESNEKWKEIAKKNFKNSIYYRQIQLIYGEALASIKNLDPEKKFDLVFIDADKKNYENYFDLILPKMQKGGLILSDNVLWKGEAANEKSEEKKALLFRSYNQKLKENPKVETFILPIRDGLSISRVL